MTAREAAVKLGITLDAVYRLLWTGKLRGERTIDGNWTVSNRAIAIRVAAKRRRLTLARQAKGG